MVKTTNNYFSICMKTKHRPIVTPVFLFNNLIYNANYKKFRSIPLLSVHQM